MIRTSSTFSNKRPVRECHKCHRNGKGDEYCWRYCLGPAEESNKGIKKVSLESLESDDEFVYAKADDTILPDIRGKSNPYTIDDEEDEIDEISTMPDGIEPKEKSITEQLSDDVERALVIIIANLMSLSDTQLCILRHIFHGEDLKETGANLPNPVSKQAVFKQLLIISRSNRIVAKVIHEMMRKGHGGAQRQVSQLELFDAVTMG